MSEAASDEGVALVEPGVGPAEFAHRLLARGEIAFVRGPLRRVKAPKTPARIVALREMAVRAAIGWLSRSGGWQTRAVVSGGRRREGRIWASGVWEGLDFRFSPASMELIVRAAAASAQPGGATLGRLVRAFEGIPPAATTGDLVLFHLVLEPFLDAAPAVETSTPAEKSDAPEKPTPAEKTAPAEKPTSAERLSKDRSGKSEKGTTRTVTPPTPPPPDAATESQRALALLALSPLTALCRADEIGSPATAAEDATARAAFANRFEPLVRGDRALLLTYLDDAIARRWIVREGQRRATLGAVGARRYSAMGAALEGLADAAQAAHRPDALRPIARFFERYVVRFGQREAVSGDLRDRVHAAVPLASIRATALARVARLFEASRSLETAAERILDTPFVDRTEEEKVFVADYQERLRDLRPELEAIRRELAGEVG